MDKMAYNSEAYGRKSKIYQDFTRAEDYPSKLRDYLLPLVKGKKVLDVCCGNGKYASLLAEYALSYTGVDIAEEQIELAKKSNENKKNVKFCVGDAKKLPFGNGEFDCAISTWGVCSMASNEEKKEALDEMMRIVKKGGRVYIIEADPFDDFNRIRESAYHVKSLKVIKLILDKGFKFKDKINSYFYFDSAKEAKELFKYFWGDYSSSRIKSRRLDQEIVVLEKEKL